MTRRAVQAIAAYFDPPATLLEELAEEQKVVRPLAAKTVKALQISVDAVAIITNLAGFENPTLLEDEYVVPAPGWTIYNPNGFVGRGFNALAGVRVSF